MREQTLDDVVMSAWLPLIVFTILFLSAAQGDEPAVDYIFPAGGQRGTSVEFRVGGYNLHDRCSFEMWGDGVAASDHLVRAPQTVWFEGPLLRLPQSQGRQDYPKDQIGRVQIDADAALGWKRWRVWTSQGATPSRPFVVGELPEMVEVEIDGRPVPTEIHLPVTINGRIFPRQDTDIWTFSAQAGETYYCEVLAERIGSPLDSRLVVIGPDGETVAENLDHFGNDSSVWFTASTTGNYAVEIQDVRFDGEQHFVYRLTIRNGPYVQSAFPLGGQRGTAIEFQLYGGGVPDTPMLLDLPLQSPAPFAMGVEIEGRLTNRFRLQLSDVPETVEREPNNHTENALPVSVPGVGNGCISRPGDTDWWSVSLKQGEIVEFDLDAASLGSRLTGVLKISDLAGTVLATVGDSSEIDPRLSFTAPNDGTYFVTVQDRFGHRGNRGFTYRLDVHVPAKDYPDYELRLSNDSLTLPRGGELKYKIHAERMGGMNAPIEIVVEGLPAGVSVEGDTMAADKNEVELTFRASEEASIQTAKFAVLGRARWEDTTIERTAIRPATVAQDLDVNHVLLSVALPTPFKVVGTFESPYVERGSTHIRHYRLERGGFEGPLTIKMGDRQARYLQGITGSTMTIPPGVDEFDYPIQLSPWMEVGRTTRTVVMAVGQMKEADGTTHTVSYTSLSHFDQIIAFVEPSQLALLANPRSLLVRDPASVYEVQISLKRGAGINGPVVVELIVPDHIQGIFAEPITVAKDSNEGTLRVKLTNGPKGPFNMPLLIRATAQVKGFPYLAEEHLDVVSATDVALRN